MMAVPNEATTATASGTAASAGNSVAREEPSSTSAAVSSQRSSVMDPPGNKGHTLPDSDDAFMVS
jgi:hypothetical protein